jgi:DNA-binding winged helix-turn-helix (wHTH) protein
VEPDVPVNTETSDLIDAPVLDRHDLLRYGGRWVAVTDAQVPVVALLVSRFGSLVTNEELLVAYGSGGGATSPSALRPLVYRLRQRFSAVGLTLHVVRRRGVLLEAARSDE